MSEAFVYDKISDVEEVPSPNLINKGHVNEKPYIVT